MFDRSIKPLSTGKINFTQPKIEIYNLSNTLKLYYCKKNTLPIIQLNFLIPSGSIYNPENKEGLSQLTSLLLDEGAGNLTSFEISDKLELLGSILNIRSDKEYTNISLLCLKEKFIDSLEILSKILLFPNFTVEDFERQKLKLFAKNIQLNDDPSFLASNMFNKIIYKNSPFQFPATGLNSSIENLSNQDVKNFFETHYLPNGSFVVLVGNIESREAIDLLNNYFSNWEIKTNSKPDLHISRTNKKIVIVDKPNAAQSEIRVGHFSKGRNSDDFFARTILNSILGGQFSSRINLNLREDKGYTYGAHTRYNYNSVGSTFSVSTSVKTENTGDTIKEILFELASIQNSISNEELEFSKSYLIKRHPSLFETYTQIASNIAILPIFNLPVNYFQDFIDKIKNVTENEVLNAAKENIILDELLIVIAGNKESIEKQLTKFDSFDIEIN